MKPLQDFVLIKKIVAPEKTAGGLFIPNKAADANSFALGEVLAVGPGIFTQQGIRMPLNDLTIGMTVAYSKMAAEQRKDSVPPDMALVREGEIYMDMTQV